MKVKLSDELVSILEMIAQGKSNKEIAIKLNYSRRNIEYKINKLFKLYKVENRVQLSNEFVLEKMTTF